MIVSRDSATDCTHVIITDNELYSVESGEDVKDLRELLIAAVWAYKKWGGKMRVMAADRTALQFPFRVPYDSDCQEHVAL